METKYLEWDSDFFGVNVFLAKPGNDGGSFSRELKTLMDSGKADLIYVYSEPSLDTINKEIEALGGILYDSKVIYHKKLQPAKIDTPVGDIIEYHGDMTPRLRDLAVYAGEFSRFKLDPLLNTKFEELYSMWMKNSLNGKLADKVFVAMDKEEIAAVITCKKHPGYGNIGLLSVAENQRGKGLGRKLVQAAENWYTSNGLSESTVVTQLKNKMACLFYENVGFTVDKIENVYHLRRNNV